MLDLETSGRLIDIGELLERHEHALRIAHRQQSHLCRTLATCGTQRYGNIVDLATRVNLRDIYALVRGLYCVQHIHRIKAEACQLILA